MKTSRRWVGNLGRAFGAIVGLGLVWVGWQPTYFNLPEDLARPASVSALAALEVGATFLIDGVVEPVEGESRDWQGRFAFVHRQRKDLSTGLSREQRVVDIEDWRPALELSWAGGTWRIPAVSYGLEHAPVIKPRWWPRKAFGTMRVDDWHKSSTGFRRGEEALALGRIQADGVPRIERLMASPVEKVVAKIGYENRLRYGMVLAFKVVLSLFCLAYGLPGVARSPADGTAEST